MPKAKVEKKLFNTFFINLKLLKKQQQFSTDTVAIVTRKATWSPGPYYKCHLKCSMKN